MRRWITYLIVAVAVLLAGFMLFFLWASSGVLSEEDLVRRATYMEPAAPDSVPDTLTVMTYNIGYLSGMTNNEAVARSRELYSSNLEAAAGLIEGSDPDLIAFQEIDFGAERSYDVHQVDTLAALLNYPYGALAVNWDERYLPWPGGLRLNRHFGRVHSGQAVLSRFPITEAERIVLRRPSHPFYYDAFYLDRLAQVVQVDVGRPLVIINVHLEAFDEDTREQQAARVQSLYEQYQRTHPVLLIGDFNSIMPQARQSDRLDPQVQRRFAQDRTLDILLQAPHLKEAFPSELYAMRLPETFTFPSDNPNFKIDHIFYDASRIEAVDAYVASHPDQPSDHRPVVMRFTFREQPADSAAQDTVSAATSSQ